MRILIDKFIGHLGYLRSCSHRFAHSLSTAKQMNYDENNIEKVTMNVAGSKEKLL